MSLMGLDIGTSGCKCTIFEENGTAAGYAYQEYPVYTPETGRYELDANLVWEAVKKVIRTAAAENHSDAPSALCVSSFGEAAVPVDAAGHVLHASLLYTDTRGTQECRYLVDRLGRERIMALAGVPAHPMYTLSKVMWFQKNLPSIFQKTWKFMLFEDFILYRLGGVPAIDYSLAARTMAFDVVKKQWSAEMLEAAGVAPDIFSPAVASGSPVSTILPQLAEELGVPSSMLLVTGGHDQVCAALGGGVVGTGTAINGVGTVECITPLFDKPVLDAGMLENSYACVPYVMEGTYVTYAFNFTGGALLKWYRDCFAQKEVREAEQKGISVYELLDSRAAKQPQKILVLPHFAGSGTPHMDPEATGAIVGLGFDTTRPQLYRAMLEGSTYEMRYNLECMEGSGINIDRIMAAGGGARSELWMQIKADILGRRVCTLEVDEAGTLGTAMLAGIAKGIYKSAEEAAAALVRVRREFYPDPRNQELYQENYERYKRMYPAVKEIQTGKRQ